MQKLYIMWSNQKSQVLKLPMCQTYYHPQMVNGKTRLFRQLKKLLLELDPPEVVQLPWIRDQHIGSYPCKHVQ